MKLRPWQSKDGRNIRHVYITLPDNTQIFAKGKADDSIEWGSKNGIKPSEARRLAGLHFKNFPLSFDELFTKAAAEAQGVPPRQTYKEAITANKPGFAGFAKVGDGYGPEHTSLLDASRFSNPIPEPTRLLVDHREPTEISTRLALVPNLIVERAQLDIGDYVVPGKLIIERKTTLDWHTSMIEDSNRMLNQANSMALSGIPSIFLIEGNAYAQRRMSIEAISGTQSWMTAILGIGVIDTIDLNHTVYMIATLAKHACHGLGYDIGLREGKGKRSARESADLTASYVLESVPGISATKALVILKALGSLRAVANATPADLMQIPGVGPELSRRITAAFEKAFA